MSKYILKAWTLNKIKENPKLFVEIMEIQQ